MIEVLNKSFELQGIITEYHSLIYIRRWGECGEFELHISKNKTNVEKLKIGSMLILNKKDDYIVVIDKIDETVDNRGFKNLKVTGSDVKGLFKNRIILTPSFDRVEDTEAENVMIHYVYNHCINAKYNGIETPERNFNNLVLSESKNRGSSTVWQERLTVLHDVLKNISIASGLGYELRLDRKTKKLVFNVIEGTDRSISQTENPQIIFSEKYKNLKEINRLDDNAGYKNAGYAIGKGELEERPITTINPEGASGEDRKEILIDLGNIEDPDELRSEGEKALSENKHIKSFEGKIYESQNMKYGKDFDLGDILTVEDDNLRLIAVKEVYEPNNIVVECTFGDKIPTPAEVINKKIDSKVM